MNWVQVTDWLLIATAALWIGYDIFVVFINSMPDDSISDRHESWGRRLAFLPYAFGALCGHYWGWEEESLFAQPWAFGVAVLVGTGLSLLHHFYFRRTAYSRYLQLVYVMLGIPMGVYFWAL